MDESPAAAVMGICTDRQDDRRHFPMFELTLDGLDEGVKLQ